VAPHTHFATRQEAPHPARWLGCAMRGAVRRAVLCCALFVISPITQATVQAGAAAGAHDPIETAYRLADQQLLWSRDGVALPAAASALALLRASETHGLPSSRYQVQQIQQLGKYLRDPASAAVFDRLLTQGLWDYAQHMTQGVAAVGPHAMGGKRSRDSYQAKALSTSLIRGMVHAIKRDRIENFMRALSPTATPYLQLQAALTRYRTYQARGGWTTLPSEMKLELGTTHAAVFDLRRRLELTDNLEPSTANPQRFDNSLLAAVMRFQVRHGLTADGIVGGQTRRALNESVDRKIERLALNLDRWRQLPRNLPRNRVMVNIPEYQLRLYQEHEETLAMRVVVGSKDNPTPVIHGRLDHLVFNPYWYPTKRITRREILPSVQQDPSYLARTGMEVLRGKKPVDATNIAWNEFTGTSLPYRFRQLPGPKNSLGEVKFIFPNKHAVYMHDTPIRSQFSHDARAYSHGCIRLEQPKALASAILGWERGWSEADIAKKMLGDRPKYTKFKETLDIYLVYLTANVTNDDVFFYTDIYAHDRTPEYLLAHRLQPLAPRTQPDLASISSPPAN